MRKAHPVMLHWSGGDCYSIFQGECSNYWTVLDWRDADRDRARRRLHTCTRQYGKPWPISFVHLGYELTLPTTSREVNLTRQGTSIHAY